MQEMIRMCEGHSQITVLRYSTSHVDEISYSLGLTVLQLHYATPEILSNVLIRLAPSKVPTRQQKIKSLILLTTQCVRWSSLQCCSLSSFSRILNFLVYSHTLYKKLISSSADITFQSLFMLNPPNQPPKSNEHTKTKSSFPDYQLENKLQTESGLVWFASSSYHSFPNPRQPHTRSPFLLYFQLTRSLFRV